MRCHAMQCHAMRCDAMRGCVDAWLCAYNAHAHACIRARALDDVNAKRCDATGRDGTGQDGTGRDGTGCDAMCVCMRVSACMHACMRLARICACMHAPSVRSSVPASVHVFKLAGRRAGGYAWGYVCACTSMHALRPCHVAHDGGEISGFALVYDLGAELVVLGRVLAHTVLQKHSPRHYTQPSHESLHIGMREQLAPSSISYRARLTRLILRFGWSFLDQSENSPFGPVL